jgi:hypothetical protein
MRRTKILAAMLALILLAKGYLTQNKAVTTVVDNNYPVG